MQWLDNVDIMLTFSFPFFNFWKRVANCSGWIMETLSRTKAETFVAFLATTGFCQQNKSAKYFVSLICRHGGAFWASDIAGWGVRHSINKEKNRPDNSNV